MTPSSSWCPDSVTEQGILRRMWRQFVSRLSKSFVNGRSDHKLQWKVHWNPSTWSWQRRSESFWYHSKCCWCSPIVLEPINFHSAWWLLKFNLIFTMEHPKTTRKTQLIAFIISLAISETNWSPIYSLSALNTARESPKKKRKHKHATSKKIKKIFFFCHKLMTRSVNIWLSLRSRDSFPRKIFKKPISFTLICWMAIYFMLLIFIK